MSNDIPEELLERVKRIEDDVSDMQGDVNVLATLNKGLNRKELIDLIHDSFGTSDNKKLTWYYANGSLSNEEIAEAADIPKGSVDWAVRELDKSGWLSRHEEDGKVTYSKTNVSKNLGIESTLEDELDI